MNADRILAFVNLGIGVVGLACVFPGWLLNRPDDLRRFTWRLAAWCVASVFLFVGGFLLHGLPRIGQVIAVLCALVKVREWWRKVEQVRRFNREVARYKAAQR